MIASLTIAGMMLLAFVSVYALGPIFGGIVTLAAVGVVVGIAKLVMWRVGDPDSALEMERRPNRPKGEVGGV